MTFDEFTEKLKDAGWRATCDAQYAGIEKLYHEIINSDRAAREECEDIAIGIASHDGAALEVADAIRETINGQS